MLMPILLSLASLAWLLLTRGTPAAGMARLALTGCLAMLLARHLTPAVAAAARRFGILDHPDGRLKAHEKAVPYLGGLALGLAFFVSLSVLFRYDRRMTGMLLAGAIVLLLGLVDDLGALSWKVKFGGQALAVMVLLKSGVVMNVSAFAPAVNIVLSSLWLLGIINAMNLIDISDGLAPGVALFASAAFLVVAVFTGSALVAILSATLFGALAGFAPFNFPPARIYLGDAGSMFLGLMLGGLGLAGSYTGVSPWGLAAPLLILAVPVFDTAYVMALRLGRGRNPFLGSPDHLAVRLRRAGWPARSIALAACLTTVLTGAVAVSLLVLPAAVAPWLVGAVLSALLAAGLWLLGVDVTVRPAGTSRPVPRRPLPALDASPIGIDDGPYPEVHPPGRAFRSHGGVSA
jgi:UDP-GlcNAc:undecaprenyl-phosphate/decaprenyl-phosphate GlcNAc-1-phosphate transferase